MKLSETEIITLLNKHYPYLEQKEIDIFLSISEYNKANNKEIILKSNRTDKYVLLILKGVGRCYSINKNGEELNDYIRAEGHLIGDARVFGTEVQILNVESIGEIHFLKFDINRLEELGFENPKIMIFYLKLLKEIILILSHRVNTFVAMNASERYANLIAWNPLYLKSTFEKHLASFLGISPLTFHRVKKKSIK